MKHGPGHAAAGAGEGSGRRRLPPGQTGGWSSGPSDRRHDITRENQIMLDIWPPIWMSEAKAALTAANKAGTQDR